MTGLQPILLMLTSTLRSALKKKKKGLARGLSVNKTLQHISRRTLHSLLWTQKEVMVRNHRNGDGFTITHLLGRRVNHLPAVKLAVTGQVRPLHPAFTPHMEVPETKHWLPAGINKAVSALS